MKSACVGVLSITELKNARWNFDKPQQFFSHIQLHFNNSQFCIHFQFHEQYDR